MRLTSLAAACAAALLCPGAAEAASPALTAEEAHSIAVDGDIYLYPLVTMDVTRKQLTNMPEGSGIGGPMDQFVNVRTFPPADMKAVVRPNFDTLYSSAWLDLTKEPMVLSVETPATSSTPPKTR